MTPDVLENEIQSCLHSAFLKGIQAEMDHSGTHDLRPERDALMNAIVDYIDAALQELA